jgi:hypothetical protein
VRRLLPWTVAALGVALAVAGVVVFAVTNASAVDAGDFGWTTYAPLEPGDPVPYQSELTLSSDGWSVRWTEGHLAGAPLLVLGLLTLAGLGGWLLGLRRGRSQGR